MENPMKVVDNTAKAARMKKSGELATNLNFTDEELQIAIEGMELTLAYTMARGRGFDLVSDKLRLELNALLTYRDNRGK